MNDDSSSAAGPRDEIDTTVSHSARVWDYWLGGQDNYAVDREVGDRIAAMLPDIVKHARADRAFLGRAVRFLAAEAGAAQPAADPGPAEPGAARAAVPAGPRAGM